MKQKLTIKAILAVSLIVAMLIGIFCILMQNVQEAIMPYQEDVQLVKTASASDFTMSGTKITGYTGSDTYLTPDEFPTTATTIGFQAFSGTAAEIIELPSTITTIEASGFWNSNITSVKIPSSVTYIGSGAFYRCNYLQTVYCEFTSVSVFEYAQFSYVPDSMVIYAPYDSVSSFQSSLRLAIYRNRVQAYPVTLNYVTNNGTTMQNAQIHYGQSYASFITPLTKEGYTFLGWKDSSNNDITSTSTYLKWNNTETLTAQFEKEKYEVKIQYNNQTYWIGAQNTINNTQTFIEYGTSINLSIVADNLLLQLQDPSIRITGFEDVNSQTYNWTTVPDLGVDETIITMYPVVANKVYTLRYNTYLGTGWQESNYSYGDPITMPTVASTARPGYTYQGWVLSGTNTAFSDTIVGAWNNYDNSNPTKSVVVKWVANTYTATLVYGYDNLPNAVQQVTYDSACHLPTPTRAGYTFNGWKIGNDIYTYNTIWNIVGDATLNAQWTLNEYTITIDLDGGTLNGSIPNTCTYFDTINLPTASKLGYNFDGWKDQNNNTITTISQAVQSYALTAQWRQTVVNITSMGSYTINQDDIVYLDVRDVSAIVACQYSIAPNVSQVYIKSRNTLYTLQNIIVEQRTTPLTIVLDTVKFSSFGTVLDASLCPDLTIHSIGYNLIQHATISTTDGNNPLENATIKCNNLTITGSQLEINGGTALGALENYQSQMLDGAPGININGNMSVTAQSLVVKGGAGAFIMPGSGSATGGTGGIGIYFQGLNRTMSVASDTNIAVHGGDGGASMGFRTSGIETAGDGNYAVVNVTISGIDTQDRFYGGNGGALPTSSNGSTWTTGHGSPAINDTVYHNLNTAQATTVFVSGLLVPPTS